MNITIVGIGNIGTQLAVHSAAQKHFVTVFSSRYERIASELSIVDESGKTVLTGKVGCATNDPKTAFENADLIFVTVPSFYMKTQAEVIVPYLKPGAKICIVPGCGGGEFAFKDALAKGCVLFGFQRVPSVARLVEYGKAVCASGYRDKMYIAALPITYAEECAEITSSILGMPCGVMPHYLNLTLTPSNPILHTTRLKTIFCDYKEGVYYKTLPLFYEEWSNTSSELLLKCDEEVQNICSALHGIDLSFVKSLKEHYESKDAEALTNKICSIASFKGLKTPSVATENGFLPDFSSRYFTADFMYGLAILIQIADFLGINADNMKETMEWYTSLVENDNVFKFEDYGIYSKEDFLEFYNVK